jgi:hypothetical protein
LREKIPDKFFLNFFLNTGISVASSVLHPNVSPFLLEPAAKEGYAIKGVQK